MLQGWFCQPALRKKKPASVKFAGFFTGGIKRNRGAPSIANVAVLSAIGVDLNDDKVRCSGPEGMTKFNTAKAKYTEIATFAEAHGLTKRYEHFFFHNGSIGGGFGCAK